MSKRGDLVPLRHLAGCLDGRRVPLNASQRAAMQGDIPYWGAGGVVDYVDSALFNEQLVLLGEDGAPFSEAGRDVAFLVDGPVWVNNHIHVLRPTSVDARFLTYALNSVDFGEYITGSTRDKLTQEDMLSVKVWSPPIDEQRRIADFLDAETSRIDQLEKVRQAQLQLLDEHKLAFISDTLIPGILDRSTQRWPWPWLPDLPPDRPIVRLRYVCQLQPGLTVDSTRVLRGKLVTRPYLRVANVQAGRLDLKQVTQITVPSDIARRATLRPGDVLMTEGGDLDKLGRGTVWRGELRDCLHQNHVFAVRPDASALDSDYLAYITQTLHGRNYFESTGAKTTNLASTNSSKILELPVPLPSLEKQRDLVAKLNHYLDSLGRARSTITHQLALLAERRQALITGATTGQLGVVPPYGVTS